MEIEKAENEALRRRILQALREADGSSIRAKRLRVVIDLSNDSTTWSDYVDHLQFLTGAGLIAVYDHARGEADRSQTLSSYFGVCKRGGPFATEAEQIMVRLRQKGREFLEGYHPEVVGVARD